MKTAFLLAAFVLLAFAPLASADPVPFVIVYGPHPDGEGTGNYCADALIDADHVGGCAGTYGSCPIYVNYQTAHLGDQSFCLA